MTTHKVFKRHVRARMAKTGEAYTTARAQLLRQATGSATAVPPDAAPTAATPSTAPVTAAADTFALPTSDSAAERATGRPYAAWFADLDDAGAQAMGHTRIAAWLIAERGVPGWWAQTITVAYERARGLRATHQVGAGFQVTATRTIAAGAPAVLHAFADPAVRQRWLPGVDLTPRRTTARNTARFDWPDPPSRLVVYVTPKDDGRSVVSLAHERLPDAAAVSSLKPFWRERLGALRRLLEN